MAFCHTHFLSYNYNSLSRATVDIDYTLVNNKV